MTPSDLSEAMRARAQCRALGSATRDHARPWFAGWRKLVTTASAMALLLFVMVMA